MKPALISGGGGDAPSGGYANQRGVGSRGELPRKQEESLNARTSKLAIKGKDRVRADDGCVKGCVPTGRGGS